MLLACGAAQDLLTPGEQVLRELRAALAKPDRAQAIALLGEVGGLVRYPASADEAAALLKIAADASRSKDVEIAAAALGALAATGRRDASTHVVRHLKGTDKRLTLAAVQAAGRLRLAPLVPDLLKLAQKASDLTVADQAFVALGEFCRAETALRKQVVEKVLSVCSSLQRRRARWRRLRAPGLRALQRLIGRRMNSVQHFTDWWKAVKEKKDPFS